MITQSVAATAACLLLANGLILAGRASEPLVPLVGSSPEVEANPGHASADPADEHPRPGPHTAPTSEYPAAVAEPAPGPSTRMSESEPRASARSSTGRLRAVGVYGPVSGIPRGVTWTWDFQIWPLRTGEQWTGVAAIDFGDGWVEYPRRLWTDHGQSWGLEVEHTFMEPGRHTIRLDCGDCERNSLNVHVDGPGTGATWIGHNMSAGDGQDTRARTGETYRVSMQARAPHFGPDWDRTAWIDWGDGTREMIPRGGWGWLANAGYWAGLTAHAYELPGTYVIHITCSSCDASSHVVSVTAPPAPSPAPPPPPPRQIVRDPLSPVPVNSVEAGQRYGLILTAPTAAFGDDWDAVATIDLGDGRTLQLVFQQFEFWDGDWATYGTATWEEPGSYTIAITCTACIPLVWTVTVLPPTMASTSSAD